MKYGPFLLCPYCFSDCASFLLFLTVLEKEHSVMTARTKGIIGTLYCECHLVSYYRSNGGELVSLNLFIAQNYAQHKFLKKIF